MDWGALWDMLQDATREKSFAAGSCEGAGGRENLFGSLASRTRCELASKAPRGEGKKCQL